MQLLYYALLYYKIIKSYLFNYLYLEQGDLMRTLITLLVITLSNLSLCGCMTTMIWKTTPVSSKSSKFQIINEDQLLNLGKVIQEDKKDQFVVIGKKNVYLITQGNEAINEITRLNIPNSKLALITNRNNALELHIDPEKKDDHFKMDLLISIIVESPTDEVVTQLRATAKRLEYNKRHIPTIRKGNQLDLLIAIPVEGNILVSNQKIEATQPVTFAKNYKVQIGYNSNAKKSLNPMNIAKNIISTPFTLAADAVIIPLTGIFILGTIFEKH